MTFAKLPKQKWILMNSNLYKFKCIQPIKIQGIHVLTCFLVLVSFDSQEVPGSAELHLPSASAILWPCVFAMVKLPRNYHQADFQRSWSARWYHTNCTCTYTYTRIYTYTIYTCKERDSDWHQWCLYFPSASMNTGGFTTPGQRNVWPKRITSRIPKLQKKHKVHTLSGFFWWFHLDFRTLGSKNRPWTKPNFPMNHCLGGFVTLHALQELYINGKLSSSPWKAPRLLQSTAYSSYMQFLFTGSVNNNLPMEPLCHNLLQVGLVSPSFRSLGHLLQLQSNQGTLRRKSACSKLNPSWWWPLDK